MLIKTEVMQEALTLAQKYNFRDFETWKNKILFTEMFDFGIPGVKTWARIEVLEDCPPVLRIITTGTTLYFDDIPEHVTNHETLRAFAHGLTHNFYFSK